MLPYEGTYCRYEPIVSMIIFPSITLFSLEVRTRVLFLLEIFITVRTLNLTYRMLAGCQENLGSKTKTKKP